ncbi:MAG: hypothetical protein ABGX27_08800 [Desulfurobacteriaceae bacterium]
MITKKDKLSYIEGQIKMQVSDLEKAFEIIKKYKVDVKISIKEKTIEIELGSLSSTLTVKDLISMLQELEPLCVPLERPIVDIF